MVTNGLLIAFVEMVLVHQLDAMENKTYEEKELIKLRKQKTNELNKGKHLHRGGAGSINWYGIIYENINKASIELGFSFKYIKRRILSEDYKECNFV